MLSAQMHAKDSDFRVVKRAVGVALEANKTIDAGRSKMYFDLILTSLPKGVFRKLVKMKIIGREYTSDFARQYVAEGRAEGRVKGRAEGRAEIILRVLRKRFGRLTIADETRVVDACNEGRELDVDTLLAAATLNEVLGPL